MEGSVSGTRDGAMSGNHRRELQEVMRELEETRRLLENQGLQITREYQHLLREKEVRVVYIVCFSHVADGMCLALWGCVLFCYLCFSRSVDGMGLALWGWGDISFSVSGWVGGCMQMECDRLAQERDSLQADYDSLLAGLSCQ